MRRMSFDDDVAEVRAKKYRDFMNVSSDAS